MKKIILIMIVLLQAIFFDVIEVKSCEEENAKISHQYGSSADEKKDRNDFKGAIEDYTLSIKYCNEQCAAFYNRGILLQKLKDYKGAIEDFNHAIEKNHYLTEDAEFLKWIKSWSYHYRAECKLALKEYNDAIEDFNQAIKLKPGFEKPIEGKKIAEKAYKDAGGELYTEEMRLQKSFNNMVLSKNLFKSTEIYNLKEKELEIFFNNNTKKAFDYLNVFHLYNTENTKLKNEVTIFLNKSLAEGYVFKETNSKDLSNIIQKELNEIELFAKMYVKVAVNYQKKQAEIENKKFMELTAGDCIVFDPFKKYKELHNLNANESFLEQLNSFGEMFKNIGDGNKSFIDIVNDVSMQEKYFDKYYLVQVVNKPKNGKCLVKFGKNYYSREGNKVFSLGEEAWFNLNQLTLCE